MIVTYNKYMKITIRCANSPSCIPNDSPCCDFLGPETKAHGSSRRSHIRLQWNKNPFCVAHSSNALFGAATATKVWHCNTDWKTPSVFFFKWDIPFVLSTFIYTGRVMSNTALNCLVVNAFYSSSISWEQLHLHNSW